MSRPSSTNTERTDVLDIAAWHSLAWLLVANSVGLLLATLLLFPGLNGLLGEWSYGHWMPVHLNLQLYGWCSLPLVAWLLKVYGADIAPASRWGRSALWAWSAALAFGTWSWLSGQTSGKLFLDWKGLARVLFPLATVVLWFVLVWALRCRWQADENRSRLARFAKISGLIILSLVPVTLYWSADPKIYPPVNPDTGGPTGASLLESTLGIVTVLLILPYGLGSRRRGGNDFLIAAWGLFALETGLSLSLGRTNASHHLPMQFLGLASLLPWMVMMPLYYRSFEWPANSRRWRGALFCWWGILLASAWTIFLPGLLDRFKFTDGLVGHSHMAMAGFISNLNIFVLVILLGERRKVFDAKWAFLAWQVGTLGYVVVMFIAGWIEGNDHAFNFVPGSVREVIYLLRLGCGGLMTAATCHWLMQITRSLRLAKPAEREVINDVQTRFKTRLRPSECPDRPNLDLCTQGEETAVKIPCEMENVQFRPRVQLVSPTSPGKVSSTSVSV